MPRKPVFKDYPQFLVMYTFNGVTHTTECIGAKIAVDMYRSLRKTYGDNVRIAKVVVNYGEEV